jgi:hypothetical protein
MGYLFALFAVGWGFGLAYRRALSLGDIWMALYALMAALSIYFIMQGLEAFGYRVLLLGFVTWSGWRYATGTKRLQPTNRSFPRGTLSSASLTLKLEALSRSARD